jgi:hypothetical protein
MAGARYADSLRAEPPGHSLLDSRRPCIVVLAVEDQDRRSAEVREFCRTIRAGKKVPAHNDQPGWAVAQHALVQERHDLRRNSVGPGLRLQVLVPEHLDGGPQSIGRTVRSVAAVGRLERREHAAEQLSALAGEAPRAGAEQGQRQDRRLFRERRLSCDEPAEGVPEQVHALAVGRDDVGDHGDVGGKLAGRVAAWVESALALILPAHVDRDHTAAR